MTTTTPVDAPTMTVTYQGRRLAVSGPSRVYPSGLWYFRSSDADDAPTWIPASQITDLAVPRPASAHVDVRDIISATTLPVIAGGLGFVGSALATFATMFRAVVVSRADAA